MMRFTLRTCNMGTLVCRRGRNLVARAASGVHDVSNLVRMLLAGADVGMMTTGLHRRACQLARDPRILIHRTNQGQHASRELPEPKRRAARQ